MKTLNIKYNNELVITDVDDCLMDTTKSIKDHGFTKKYFWFGDGDEIAKAEVFRQAELTDWGKEFIELVHNGTIKNYLLLTAASNRLDILKNKFGITNDKFILEGYYRHDKIEFLNDVKEKAIYVDDKLSVIFSIDNDLIQCVNYPNKINTRTTRNRRR